MALWISHRGESMDAPENTASAFRLAMERDTDGMETDIHLTADGVLVCSHDSDTKRCCGVSMVIEETPWATLAKLDASHGKAAFQGEGLPTFAEALAILKPGKQFYVEIKENDPRVIEPMMAEIDKSPCSRGQIVMISFHEEVVRLFKEKHPAQRALWLASFPREENGAFRHSQEHYLEVLRRTGADGIDASCNRDFVDASFVKKVHDAGMYFAAWTLDTEELCRDFLARGIDAVTSNCAAKMRSALAKP